MFSRRVALRFQLYRQRCPSTSKPYVHLAKLATVWQCVRLPSPAFLLFALFCLLTFAGAVFAHPLNHRHNLPLQQTIPCCATVTGTLKLQGRLDHSGIQVLMWPGSNLRTTTDRVGRFSFSGLPANNINGTSIYEIEVSFPGYAGAKTTLDLNNYLVDENTPVLITLPDLWLLGGDVNRDKRINIFDLVIVGNHYGSAGASAGDINGDGRVNIQDLAVAAGNFGKENDYAWSPP